jgi:hypothetical protein
MGDRVKTMTIAHGDRSSEVLALGPIADFEVALDRLSRAASEVLGPGSPVVDIIEDAASFVAQESDSF